MLDWRTLHEVRARAFKSTAQTTVQAEFGAANGVDDHAGAVRRIPHFELELDVQRHVAERPTFQADVRPLPIGEPRNVVARADVDILRGQLLVELTRDASRLRN